jgi:Transketolase, thiamine diphosphate binding domain
MSRTNAHNKQSHIWKGINVTQGLSLFLKQLCTMSNIDALSINTIRALAADITFEANSGHPGMHSFSIAYL